MANFDQLSLLSPLFVLGLGILGTMLAGSLRAETKLPARISTIITLLLTIIAASFHFDVAAQNILGGIIEVSRFTSLAIFFISLIALIFILGSGTYLEKEKLHFSDFYILLLLLVLGAAVLVSAKDLFVLFISLELMSLPAYSLVGFRRNDSRSNEASLKYFIIGGALGAVFLLGTSFVFGATGTTGFSGIFEWSKSFNGDPALFVVGHLLILFAFLFKVASVPFHFWKPDVYEGAPVNVTGLMTTIVTSAAFIAMVRVFQMVHFESEAFIVYLQALRKLVKVSAILSLALGSTVLILQKNMKRMMAYSAINHTGYLLLGLLGSLTKPDEVYSIWFYLIGYCVVSSGLFLILNQSEGKNDQGLELVDLTGLLKRNPLYTSLFTIFFLSLAGMPFTVGFFVKYVVFMSSISTGEVIFVVFAAISTVIAAYGYLRPVGLMVMRDPDPSAVQFSPARSTMILIFLLAGFALYLGVFPQSMIQMTKGLELIH